MKLLKFYRLLSVALVSCALFSSRTASSSNSADSAADTLWTQFLAQKRASGPCLQKAMRPKTDKTDAKKRILEIETTLKEFIGKYPNDPNWWEARMQLIELGGVEGGLRIESAPAPSALVGELNEIYEDEKAPRPIRIRAGAGYLFGKMTALASDQNRTVVAAVEVDGEIEEFRRRFAEEKEISQAMILLRSLQLQVVKSGDDPALYQALLQKLAADSESEIAKMAKDLIARQQVLEDLRTEPLVLTFTAIDGTEVDLAKLRGKVVVLDFWASWCPPCVAEEKNVTEVYRKYHEQGLEVIGISYDHEKLALMNFAQENGMMWPQYFDGMGWQNKLGAKWGVTGIPAIWLLDKTGRIVSTNGREDLAGQVEKILQAP